MEDFATELLKAGYRLTRWALGYRGRVREWRRIAAACGLTNVREVRTLALTHRVEARKGPLRVTFHIEFRNQPPCVSVGRLARIGVHDRTVLMQAQHLPRAAIMIAGPAAIEDVAEAEEPV